MRRTVKRNSDRLLTRPVFKSTFLHEKHARISIATLFLEKKQTVDTGRIGFTDSILILLFFNMCFVVLGWCSVFVRVNVLQISLGLPQKLNWLGIQDGVLARFGFAFTFLHCFHHEIISVFHFEEQTNEILIGWLTCSVCKHTFRCDTREVLGYWFWDH